MFDPSQHTVTLTLLSLMQVSDYVAQLERALAEERAKRAEREAEIEADD